MKDHESPLELSEPDGVVLLVKHEPALRAIARALVPDWDRVDEPLPEASVTMWEQRDQLNSREGFLPRPSDPELQVPAAVGVAPLAAPDRVPYALAAFAEALCDERLC